ncbi:transcription factor MYB83-like [Hibiscus syriacus]|uniref:transcription factor MYB83-like n=1 Tax=Hibiscus syriacus TaxID=106335 RepID=UPI001921BAC3|nr:transcription factor MYB83-like [Hibiscus syriacus]
MRKPEDKFNNNKVKLRKGLWPREEDEKLIKYMLSDGQGCRTDIARNAGLQRCGKSCRLRWINYLRPDLRRGAFCPQEELLILHLHSILGNRWSQIGASLTGRTNNEIKNFWNSTLKKRLKNTTTITTSTSSSLNNTDSTSNPIRGGTIFPVLHEQHVDIATTYLCADISSSSSPPSTSMLCPSTLAVNRFDQSPRQHINDPYDMSGGAQFPFNGGIGEGLYGEDQSDIWNIPCEEEKNDGCIWLGNEEVWMKQCVARSGTLESGNLCMASNPSEFDCLLSDPSLAYIHWNAKKVIPSSPGWSPPPLGFLKINLDGQWRMSGIKVE